MVTGRTTQSKAKLAVEALVGIKVKVKNYVDFVNIWLDVTCLWSLSVTPPMISRHVCELKRRTRG